MVSTHDTSDQHYQPDGLGTVVITGAAGGLGRAFALGFARRGYPIAAVDIDPNGIEETVNAVTEADGIAQGFTADVTDTASTDTMAGQVNAYAQSLGTSIHAVVNNAAIYATINRSPFEEIEPDEWDKVLGVNLKGPWMVSRAFSRYLSAGSRIINLASATVYSGSEQWAHYVASKAGVIGLSRVLAKELGDREITVNTIAPGFTLTEASYGLMEDAASYGVQRGALKRSSQPDDIVGAALFLASSDSSFVTGQTIVVDGGRQFI